MMLTYHNDPNLKAQVLAELAAHREADQIVQGAYWKDGKGCAVGCLTHDPDGGHDQYPIRWGIPEWFAHLEDKVFEGLDPDEARLWPERVMAAIPVGVEIGDDLADRLAVRRLREAVLPLAPSWPDEVRDEVVVAVERVIAALLGDGDREAARSAAESAAWAAESAESAAWSAAWSAARSARSAALSAAWSAWSAALSAEAWSAEADRIIDELQALVNWILR